MKPVDIFFVRRFNDVDHIVPVVYRMAKDGKRTPLVLCLNPFMDLENDFRFRFLREKWGVTVDYVYTYFAPALLHKCAGRIVCSPYIRGSLKDLLRSKSKRSGGGRAARRTPAWLKAGFAWILEVPIRSAYALFKRFLYDWTDRVVIRKSLFNERWAEEFLKETRAESLIFDYVHADIHIAGALIAAGRKLGIPLISVPHGTSLFSGRPLVGPSDDHARVRKSGVDYYVVHHHRDAQVLAGYDFDPKKLRVLGSARYCREWEEVLHRIVPPDEIPCSNGRERKLRVVYMERGADRHGAYKHLVWETLERIAALDFVNFVIKPPTRTDRLHFSRLPESVVIANDINSVNLCKWADVIVGTVTSILLEVFWQRKVLLYPKYFHDDLMWFEEIGACWMVHSPAELEMALRKLKDQPSYQPYPESAVEEFLGQIVYNGKPAGDVLESYCRFIAEAALDARNQEIHQVKTQKGLPGGATPLDGGVDRARKAIPTDGAATGLSANDSPRH